MFVFPFADAFPWGDVISGTAGLINGIFNSAATNRANKRNIQFAKESQAEQERFAKEMFNMENEYNSPEAVMQRLASAGINPNAYWSQSSGTAGMASGDSSVSPVTPNIQPVPSPIQGLVGSSPFESIMKLKEIRKMESETKRQDIENEYLGDWYSQEIAKGEAKAALDRAEKQLRDLDIKWFDKSKRAELRKYQNEAFYFAAAGKNQRAQAALNKWKAKFEKWHIEEYAPEMLNELIASIDLIREQKTTEKHKQSSLDATAYRDTQEGNFAGARTTTENKVRDLVIASHKLQNGLDALEFAENAKVFKQKTDALLTQYKNAGLISEAEYKQAMADAAVAEKENSWWYWDKVFNYIERANKGANLWAPWAISRSDDNTHNETVTHYDARGNKTSSTTINRRNGRRSRGR